MKNYLVLLVTIGIGYAWWYQPPAPPEKAAATPPPAPVPAATPFIPSHTALDEPAQRVGHRQENPSVLLGDDKSTHLHP